METNDKDIHPTIRKFIPIAQHMLDTRRNPQVEITAHLHERCNLSCSFCFCDVKEDLSKAFINCEKIAKVKNVMDKSKTLGTQLVIHYMGGEIFDPDIFDEQKVDDYVNMVKELDEYGKSIGFTEIDHNFVSNLVIDLKPVFSLLERVRDLGIQISIGTSYDAKGRFNKATKAIWLDNIKALKEYGEKVDISMLFTKPFIKELLAEKDPTFKQLYNEGYRIYIDYYTPTTGYGASQALLQANMPSDLDLLKAFVYLIDNYPSVSPINDFITKQGFLSCRRSELTTPDSDWCKCGNLHLADPIVIFYKSKIKPNDNREIETRFMLERDCLTCEHFSYCQMGCFMQHDFSKRTQLKDCLFKLAYDYAQNRKPIDFDKLETFFGVKEI